MRNIHKQTCDPLDDWNRKNPQSRYQDLDDATRRSIRACLLREQHGLCAFCCKALGSVDECHNEHLRAQATHPSETLDYDNLVASCNTKRQCGDAHGSQDLPLTPLMPECETEFRFRLSGRVEGRTDRARETIRVLNLGDREENNKALIEKRKQLCDALIWQSYGASADELEIESPDIIALLIEEISRPQDGLLDPFAPVLINVLQQQLDR